MDYGAIGDRPPPGDEGLDAVPALGVLSLNPRFRDPRLEAAFQHAYVRAQKQNDLIWLGIVGGTDLVLWTKGGHINWLFATLAFSGVLINLVWPQVFRLHRTHILVTYKVLKAIAVWVVGNVLCRRSGTEEDIAKLGNFAAITSQLLGGKVVFLLLHAASAHVGFRYDFLIDMALLASTLRGLPHFCHHCMEPTSLARISQLSKDLVDSVGFRSVMMQDRPPDPAELPHYCCLTTAFLQVMVGIALPLAWQYYRLAVARGDYNIKLNPGREQELRARSDMHTGELAKALCLAWLTLAVLVWTIAGFFYM